MFGNNNSGLGAGFKRNKKRLVLDNVSDVVLALSLRKLVSSYTGYCLKVRRGNNSGVGDNVEANVSFYFTPPMSEPAVTLDSTVTITYGNSNAATLGQFVAASGYADVDSKGAGQSACVVTWYNQSGTGLHAVQTTVSLQPRLVNAGVIDKVTNGKPSMYWNGANSINIANFSCHTIMAAFVLGKGTGYMPFIEQGFYLNGEGNSSFSNNQGQTLGFTNGWANNNVLNQTSYICSNNKMATYKNRNINRSEGKTITNVKYTNTLYVGSRNNTSVFSIGLIPEIIILSNKALDDTVRNAIETNQMNYYGVT